MANGFPEREILDMYLNEKKKREFDVICLHYSVCVSIRRPIATTIFRMWTHLLGKQRNPSRRKIMI